MTRELLIRASRPLHMTRAYQTLDPRILRFLILPREFTPMGSSGISLLLSFLPSRFRKRWNEKKRKKEKLTDKSTAPSI